MDEVSRLDVGARRAAGEARARRASSATPDRRTRRAGQPSTPPELLLVADDVHWSNRFEARRSAERNGLGTLASFAASGGRGDFTAADGVPVNFAARWTAVDGYRSPVGDAPSSLSPSSR